MTAHLLAWLALVSQDPTQAWQALPLPALCAPPAPHGHPPALWSGAHLRPLLAAADVPREARASRLPLSSVVQMLEEDARQRGASLEFFRGSPLLLVRGDAAAVEGARARLADLERCTRVLEVELTAQIERAGAAPLRESARVLSGEETCFGARVVQSFLESYEVEVAADSGVARPVMSTLATGTTLHVTAARLDGGKQVFLSGLFDQAELVEMGQFDPATNDLGELQVPRLRATQAAFAGIVDSGGALEIALTGSDGVAWKLRLEARTARDPADAEAGGWAILDLAFLAREARALPPFGPGVVLGADMAWTEEATLPTALPPSTLAASLEAARGERSRGTLYWSEELLFVPRSEPGLLAGARALARGAEELRRRTQVLELAQGALAACLPVTSGFPARFSSGLEAPHLIAYRTELAPQSWMPSPEVATAFEGSCVWLLPQGEHASFSAWTTHGEAAQALTKKQARLGSLQTLQRGLSSARALLFAQAGAREFFAAPALPLRISLSETKR